MNMRVFAVLLTMLVISGAHAAEKRLSKPNVIVILSDDMGYADIGVHGCKDIPTPNIDRIAARGVRFTNAYANGSFCTPTRSALMSGRYQHRHGNEDLANTTGPLPLAVETLPARLTAAGYATAMVGKWHLGDKTGFHPVDRGFGEFFGFVGGGHYYLPKAGGTGEYYAPILRNHQPVEEKRYLTDAFGDEAATFVRGQKNLDKPFYLYLAFNAVHTPLQATEEDKSRFNNISNERRRTYAAMLSAMDRAIGRVIAELQESDMLEDTLVVFHNDNGGPTTRNAVNGSLNTPLRGSKCETFEGGIRSPMLMQWPGMIPEGSVYHKPVITFDISATVLAAATANTQNLDGVNLLPFVNSTSQEVPHETLFWRSRTMSNNFAVRQGDWKYVHSTEGEATPGRKQKPATDMLFNLADDLSEQHDLSAQQPGRLAALKKLYQQWSDEVDADCRKLGIEPPVATKRDQSR